jgi:hypothetical protein
LNTTKALRATVLRNDQQIKTSKEPIDWLKQHIITKVAKPTDVEIDRLNDDGGQKLT